MAQYPQRPGEADNCRDFLRTGRCKYGESCKYHHPSNVQNGGGVRTPLDPSEPPFPIRPNEPPCQYYLKHGTCKFGQTCKFHHPPSSPKQQTVDLLGHGGSVGPSGSSVLSSIDMLLPQRPSEPDCIYFLRNGRCKYGATCKYHHPMQLEDNTAMLNSGNATLQRIASIRPRDRSHSGGSGGELTGSGHLLGGVNSVGVSGGANGIPIQFLNGQGHMSHQGPTHIVLNDGSIALMVKPSQAHLANNGNTANSSFANSSASGQYYAHPTATNSPIMRSPVFSSVSSSYEPSNIDYVGRGVSVGVGGPGHGDRLNRSSLDNPHGSQSRPTVGRAGMGLHRHQQQHHHVVRSPRGASFREHEFSPLPLERSADIAAELANCGPRGNMNGSLSSPVGESWPGSSLSPAARAWDVATQALSYGPDPNVANNAALPTANSSRDVGTSLNFRGSSSVPSNLSGDGLVPQLWDNCDRGSQLRSHDHGIDTEGNWDEGLSTMTSALLNMLDTPEERSSTPPPPPRMQQPRVSLSSSPSTHHERGIPREYAPRAAEVSNTKREGNENLLHRGLPAMPGPSVDFLRGNHQSPGGVGSRSPRPLGGVSPTTWQAATGQQVQPGSSVSPSPNVGLFLS